MKAETKPESLADDDTTYTYQAFGFVIESDIQCPELTSGDGPPDIRFRYDQIPEKYQNPSGGLWYNNNGERLFLNIKGIGSYLISGGNEVIIDREVNAKEEDIRLFLLGSAMGGILYQRDILPLHGSAIETKNGCVLFVGESGIGKSTLAAGFSQKGYRVVTDDVCAVRVSDYGVPMVTPAYPQIKLCEDSLAWVGECSERLRLIKSERMKKALPLTDGFYEKPLKLYRIYALTNGYDSAIDLTPQKGVAKIQVLVENTYRLFFLQDADQRTAHFKKCSNIAGSTDVIRVARPNSFKCLEEMIIKIEVDFSAPTGPDL